MKNIALLLIGLLCAAAVTGCSLISKNHGDCPAAACVGDCNGDGAVSPDEAVLASEIAAGNEAVTNCLAADGNGDGKVTSDEVVKAGNNAKNGCRP